MGGGGGGGGNDIAAQNAQDEAAKRSAIEQLKILFGLSNANENIGPAPVAPVKPAATATPRVVNPAAGIWSGQPATTGPDPVSTYNADLQKYQTDLANYNAKMANAQSGSRNASQLETNIANQENAVSGYLTPQHERQLRDAELRTTDRLAAQGLSGSSVDVEQRDKVNFTDQQGRRAIAAKAKNAGQDMRNRLMTAYSELSRQIAAGGGYDATSALTARNAAATTQAAEEPWQNLFTNVGLIADLQAPSAYANTMASLRKQSTSPGSVGSRSSAGTITRV
jgi:hypothetical protein